jgi:hypothetical protein
MCGEFCLGRCGSKHHLRNWHFLGTCNLFVLEPILTQFGDLFSELVKIAGFHNVTACSEAVGFVDMGVGGGRGEHHDRNGFRTRIIFQFLQYFKAVEHGHVKVEQDQSRFPVNASANIGPCS